MGWVITSNSTLFCTLGNPNPTLTLGKGLGKQNRRDRPVTQQRKVIHPPWRPRVGSYCPPTWSLWGKFGLGGLGESSLAAPAHIWSRDRCARLGRRHRLPSFFLPTINPWPFSLPSTGLWHVWQRPMPRLGPFPTSNRRHWPVCADELTANRCKYRRSILSPSRTPSALAKRILSRKRETSFLRILLLKNKIQKDTKVIQHNREPQWGTDLSYYKQCSR